MAADPNPPEGTPTTDAVVNEAKRRFDRCSEWEATARERFLADIKFAHGDSDNGYQWPNAIRRSRDVDQRPCLTMNVVRQHNLQIVNDAKRNKSAIKIQAVGNGATKEAADVWEGIVRHIEYQSRAQDAYSLAGEFQVAGGIGWLRLVTRYVDEDSFDQDIFIEPVTDPLSVYMDPDAKQRDGSDAKFAFVFDIVPRDDFYEAYPRLKSKLEVEGDALINPMGVTSGDGDWVTKDHIRVCEYFRLREVPDQLVSFVDSSGARRNLRKSKCPSEVWEAALVSELSRVRDVADAKIEWFLIVGNRRVDETTWPGRYIPLIRMIGEENTIEGRLDRKGHTRAMKDAQRMYNYNASSQVEFVALQSKTPWAAPAAAIENFESYWNTANTHNHSVLPFNHIDDSGEPIPAPTRTEPPAPSNAFETGMSTSFNQMMMTSGQWQNQMGMGGNERTGEAIARRQEQGDNATFHFIDNFGIAIRALGTQILDLAPRVYDTQRVIKVLAEDGTDLEIQIDPAARQAFAQRLGHQGEVVARIFNPSIGRYEVQASSGPAFGTRREETVRALTLILTQAPQLTAVIGDLLLNAMDFKEAQEAALRLKRMVPAEALGQGPSQREQLLLQQVQSLQGTLVKTMERYGKDTIKLAGRQELRDIEAYRAETDRLKALADQLPLDQEGVKAIIEQLVGDALATKLGAITSKSIPEAPDTAASDFAPPPGAMQAHDGKWYLPDKARPGKYLMVGPGGGESGNG